MDTVARLNEQDEMGGYALQGVPLSSLDYIPARHLNILKKYDITTVYDLLYEFPTRYENFIPTSIQNAVWTEYRFRR